jgi:hypothetical protein
MKSPLLSAALLLGMVASALAQVGKDDLKKLAQAGLSDDTVIAFVKSHGPVAPLSPDDLAELKQAGMGEKALTFLVSPPAKDQAAPATSTSTTYASSNLGYSYYDYPNYYYSSYAYPSYYYQYSYPYFGFGVDFYSRGRDFGGFHHGYGNRGFASHGFGGGGRGGGGRR